jgi:hypothetical protein
MATLELLIKPLKFQEAIKRLGKKRPVARRLSSKQWAAMPTQIRERAYFTANVESMKFLNRSKKMIKDYLSGAREMVTTPDGRRVSALKKTGRADFVYEMQKLAKQTGMGNVLPPGEDMSRDMITRTKDIASETRLNLIFDTQTQQAQSYGYYKQGQDPAILDAYPAQRFIRAEQRKVPRPLHKSNRNEVRRKDDMEFWLKMNDQSIGGFGVPFGPWGFNSGMDVEDVRRDKAIQMGLIAKNEQVLPPDDTFNKGLKASADVEPEFLKKFLDKMGMDAYTNGEFVEIIEKISKAPAPAPARKVPKKVLEPETPRLSAFEGYKVAKKKANAILKKYPAAQNRRLAAIDSRMEAKLDWAAAQKARAEKRQNKKVTVPKYKKMTEAQLTKEVDKLSAKVYKASAEESTANHNLSQLNKDLTYAVSSQDKYGNLKPNNFKGKALNPQGRPQKMKPEWEKGIKAFNALTGDSRFEDMVNLNHRGREAFPEHPLTMSNNITQISPTIKRRAYSAWDKGIFLKARSDAGTVVHEFGHQLEGKQQWIREMTNKWLKQRLGRGEEALRLKIDKETKAGNLMTAHKAGKALEKYKLRRLNEIRPLSDYKNNEVAFEDDFLDPYVGKVYDRGDTEIVSMGLEWMYKNPAEFHKKDPDHFDLILRILKGVQDLDVKLPPTGAWNLKEGSKV